MEKGGDFYLHAPSDGLNGMCHFGTARPLHAHAFTVIALLVAFAPWFLIGARRAVRLWKGSHTKRLVPEGARARSEIVPIPTSNTTEPLLLNRAEDNEAAPVPVGPTSTRFIGSGWLGQL